MSTTFSANTVITSIRPNPKKPGSATHSRYGLYRENMTVAEFLAAGGRRVDLPWDLERGHISMHTPLGGGLAIQHGEAPEEQEEAPEEQEQEPTQH